MDGRAASGRPGRVAGGVRVLDAGCGELPFRAAITAAGRRCIANDIVQNRMGSVAIIGALDALPDPWPHAVRKFPVIVCTEVLEHVASRRMRRSPTFAALSMTGGRVVLTTPFLFPLHVEPYRLSASDRARHRTACRGARLRRGAARLSGDAGAGGGDAARRSVDSSAACAHRCARSRRASADGSCAAPSAD